MALTTLSAIKALLNIPAANTDQDDWLTALQGAAEQTIKSYCGRDFEQASYTEYYTGTGLRTFVLRQTPVSTISSLYLDQSGNFGQNPDGAFDSTTQLTYGEDYVLDLNPSTGKSDTGIVFRINTIWPRFYREYYIGRMAGRLFSSEGNIKVTYTAGYSTIPADLQYAVAYLTAYMKRNIGTGAAINAERIGDYSYELIPPRWLTDIPMLGEVRQILSRYRDQVI